MGILLFVLKYMFISLLLLKMMYFPDQQKSWPVPLRDSVQKEIQQRSEIFVTHYLVSISWIVFIKRKSGRIAAETLGF